MKKILSMIMVIGIALGFLVPPVKAAPEKGTITISNATVGQEYEVYKIFDAIVGFNDDDSVNGVTYELIRSDANKVLFDELFGEDGKKTNLYFDYNPNTDEVTVKNGADTLQLTNYLKGLVEDLDGFNPVASKEATSDEVKFTELDFGYYVITSSLGAFVTIDSSTPDATVIDKNQKPGQSIEKFVQDGYEQKKDEEGKPVFDDNGEPVMVPKWTTSNSATIGKIVDYKVSFEATNYDGMNKVEYYQILDSKGDGLWVEFNSIRVYINGEELPLGHYLCEGEPTSLTANQWSILGNTDEWEKLPEEQRTIANAQWYLVHTSYDQFRILIPWLEGYKIVSTSNTNGTTSYSVSYTDLKNAKPLNESPATVELYYDAAVEYNAEIGTGGNLFNSVYANWGHAGGNDSTPEDKTNTYTYGAAITKKDATDQSINLAGAQFKIYSDKDCKNPVYVIPTGVDGVYIIDSKGLPIEDVSGAKKETTREIYKAYLEDYLGPDYANKRNNLLETQVNGVLIVLGLEEGTYYFKEVQAPTGYTSLTAPHAIEVTAAKSKPFSIYADKDGNVANINQAQGGFTEVRYTVTSDIVLNGKGQTLPTTGAKGTVMLITAGTIISILFAILLITHKKMSIYKD